MNLAPRYEFLVGLKSDILQYIANSYGEKLDADVSVGEGDLAKIVETLGDGEAEVEEEKKEDGEPEIDETDSGIVRLANQLIIEAISAARRTFTSSPTARRIPAGSGCASTATA